MSWKLDLNELSTAVRGEVVQKGITQFRGVTTDGRGDNEGKVFFPLVGETHDAHNFIDQALEHKAAAFITHRPLNDLNLKLLRPNVSVVQVQDTLRALQDLARYWRKKSKAQFVAITGTNGKTTTKEFAATLIGSKYVTHASKASFNNHFGVPLTILGVEPQHQVAILEMGMNHPGELSTLVDIGCPDVALVTMVGRGHLEGMGSIEEVAREKEVIYSKSPATAKRVLNLDNPFTGKMRARFPKDSQVITFSAYDSSANVHLKEVVSTLDYIEVSGQIGEEPGKVRVPVFGRQNINNLMAAAGLALACGVEADRIWRALPQCQSTWGRNQIVPLTSGARLIFDGYNANPESMSALIENVSRLKVNGKKIVVLGEMLEMGEQSPQLHFELGAKVGESSVDWIWFIGPHSSDFEAGVRSTAFRKNIVVSKSYEDSLAAQIANVLEASDIVLVKGSRGMKLERVVSAFHPIEFESKK